MAERLMKDSGIEWIGRIPEKWKIAEVKRLFNITRGRVIAKSEVSEINNENLYPIYSSQTKNSGCMGYTDTYDYDCESLTWTTDGANAGTVFYRNGKYCITNVCGILLKKNTKTNMHFMNYSVGLSTEKYRRADINGYKIMSNEMEEIPVVYPVEEEQARIADFLDKKVSEIDAVISKTKESIGEYKKYVLSLIDFMLSEKENETYSYYKLGNIGNLKNGLNFKSNERKPIKFLGVGDFKDHVVIDSIEQFSEVYLDDPPEDYLLKNGDIVFVRSNGSKELVGRSVMVDNVDYPLIYSGFCIRFRNNNCSKVNNYYLLYYFRSLRFRELLRMGSGGTNINNLNQELLNSIRIPIPPIQTQNEIVNALNKLSNDVEKLIDRKNMIINELEQYKKSLIYEYVTGKRRILYV